MSDRPFALVRLLAPIAALLGGCAGREAGDWAKLHEVTPAALVSQAASDAALAADHRGRVALTWVTGDSLRQDLWLALSADSGLTFAAPVRVNQRRGRVSSWAECRPTAVFGAGGELLIAWSERRGSSPRDADLVVRASGDGGRTLGPPVVVNDDALDGWAGFHGFPSLVALPAGGWFVVWMDPREHATMGDSAAVASLFTATSGDGGLSWSDNRPITSRACPRCRATAASDPNGLVTVAYRAPADHARDPALAVSHDRGTHFALDTVLVEQGWRLSDCPVDGPSLTVDDQGGGHLAWYTGLGGGGAWIAPWRADDGLVGLRRPLSDSLVSTRHPQLARLGRGTLVLVEGRRRADPGRRVIAMRGLEPDGALTPWLFLGADARDAWMAPAGERSALVCWTERGGEGDRVRVVRLSRR
ncbi:MAG: sialidase family protein [Candidatus Eiseniibacteriota bacterium]